MRITKKMAQTVLKTVDCGLSSGLGTQEPGFMCVEAAVCYALGLPHGDDPACVDRDLRRFKIGLNDANWSSNEARAKGLRRLALIQLGSRDKLDSTAFRQGLVDLSIHKWLPLALREVAKLQKEPHKTNLIEAADNCELKGDYDSTIRAKKQAHAAADAAAADAADAAAANAAADAADAADAAAANAAADAAADAAAANAAAANAAADAADAAAANAAAYVAANAARDKFLSNCAEDVVQLLIKLKVLGVKWLYLTEEETQ